MTTPTATRDARRRRAGATPMTGMLLVILGLLSTAHAGAAELVTRPSLGLDGAKAIAAAAVAWAREHRAPGGAIAVVDAGGSLVYLERLDGTFPAAPGIAEGKARTAAMFRKPTRVFEDIVNQGRYTMLALPQVAAFTPLQGGVPVELDGVVVGAVGVSGAASAKQDDEIASAAVETFLAGRRSAAREVIHVPGSVVDAGFHRDATLVADPAFRVNASHRDAAGEAEIHLADTDIFYVLEGSATLVTGGEIVDPREVSPNEVRGARLRDGVSRILSRGDVITIPRGVPHWFSQVRPPFLYYVVKSTEAAGG